MSTSVDGLNSSINILKKFVQNKKHKLKRVELILKNYEDRLSISESGLATTTNSYSDVRTKLHSATKVTSQLSSRNTHLEKKLERMSAELAKQESYVSSLEQRVSIVSENYAEPEQSRIAHELSRLNEKKSSILSIQTEAVNQIKEKESDLAQLTAKETSEKAKSKSLQSARLAPRHGQTLVSLANRSLHVGRFRVP